MNVLLQTVHLLTLVELKIVQEVREAHVHISS